MPISAPAGYLDVTNATLRGSQIVTTGYVGVANANPVNHLSVGSNLHVNDTASNVLQVSGNVSANRFILGGISIEPTFDLESVTNVGNVTPYTLEFRNDTTGFYSSSNVEVGTANLFVDTTTGRVGVGTGSPSATLDVNGKIFTQSPQSFVGHYSPPNVTYSVSATSTTSTHRLYYTNVTFPYDGYIVMSTQGAWNSGYTNDFFFLWCSIDNDNIYTGDKGKYHTYRISPNYAFQQGFAWSGVRSVTAGTRSLGLNVDVYSLPSSTFDFVYSSIHYLYIPKHYL